MSALFIINGTDLTSHITVPSYKVSEFPVYEEWKDANKVTHRDVIRYRVQGSFTMYFDTDAEYWDFINLIEENRTLDDYVIATVALNNKKDLNNREPKIVTKSFYISFDPVNNGPLYQRKAHEGMEVTIEER